MSRDNLETHVFTSTGPITSQLGGVVTDDDEF